MVWLDKLLRLRSVAYIVVIAFVGFAIWQLLFHVIFMVVLRVHSMLAQHLISLTVETAGAATLTVIVVRAVLQANRELTELHREKDMLTSIIVHDLRQPLTGLIGGLAGAAADPSLPTQTREMLALARESGGELIQMVNDLLDISRLEAGQPLTEKRGWPPMSSSARAYATWSRRPGWAGSSSLWLCPRTCRRSWATRAGFAGWWRTWWATRSSSPPPAAGWR